MTTHDAAADTDDKTATPAPGTTGAPEAPLPKPTPAPTPVRRQRPRKATGADEPGAAPPNPSPRTTGASGAATSRTDRPARDRARKAAKAGPETVSPGTAASEAAGTPKSAAPAPAPARERRRKAANAAPKPAPISRAAEESAPSATGGPTAPAEAVPVSGTVEAADGRREPADTSPAPVSVDSAPPPAAGAITVEGTPEAPADTAGDEGSGPAETTAAQVPSVAPASAGVTGTPARRRPPRVRVLWLAKGLGLGGAERLLLNCARHVDRSRFDVEVAYVLPNKDALAADLERAGVPVHCLVRKPDRHRADPLWPVRLRSLAKERGYGLVHTHMPVPAVAARLLLRGDLSVPLVHTEHTMWPLYRLPTRLANAATYGRNDAVVAVSHAVAGSVGKAARSHGEGWLSTIHHGPDLGGAPTGPDARVDARKALGVPQDAVVVGTVGNHTPKKDQRTLLDAFAVMRRNHSGAVLVLIGSGPLEERLREHAASLGLGSSVVFAGSRTDVPALLPGLDVFALSSRQEGLPVALMEAMASGLPSVVTRVGGIPEIVDQGVEGLLVQPGDTEALSVALGRLVAGTPLRARMSAAARERARHFDAARAQQAIEAVYERVLAARAATTDAPVAAPASQASAGPAAEPAEPAEPL